MPELWSYALSDFILFSPRVYYRFLEMRNAALWPLHLVTVSSGLAMVYWTLRPTPARTRLVLSVCGALWLWMAWNFFWRDYASINWAAAYFAPLATLQGGALFLAAVKHTHTNTAQTRTVPSILAIGVLVFSVLGYPFVALGMERNWPAGEVIGIAADPTAVATLAALVLIRVRMRWLLALVPIMWCLISGLTLWALNAGDFFVAPLCAITTIGLMAYMGRRTPYVDKS